MTDFQVDSANVLERVDFWNDFFTPLAARRLCGYLCPAEIGPADLFEMEVRFKPMLDRLFNGYPHGFHRPLSWDSEDLQVAVPVYRAVATSKSGTLLQFCWLIEHHTLEWRTSGEAGKRKDGADFPELLMIRFGLERKDAWEASLALVASALVNRQDDVAKIARGLFACCTTKAAKAAAASTSATQVPRLRSLVQSILRSLEA